MTVRIKYSNGTSQVCADMDEAMESLRHDYGGFIETEQPDPDRILVWRTPAESIEDDGTRAIAAITWE